jgi:hypothetical protein
LPALAFPPPPNFVFCFTKCAAINGVVLALPPSAHIFPAARKERNAAGAPFQTKEIARTISDTRVRSNTEE